MSDPLEIKVLAMIGEDCIAREDGELVFAELHAALSEKRNVHLNFHGVNTIASPFLNRAIGDLYRDFNSDTLNKFLKISDLNEFGRFALKRVIENAKKYYSSAAFRSAIDNAPSPLED